MKTILKIIGAIISVLGALSAIKTLVPPDITYQKILESTLFISGWIVCFILSIVLIYQEENHREKTKEKNDTLIERANDKDYLKHELSKSNISLNHLTSRLDRTDTPIPRVKPHEEVDEI